MLKHLLALTLLVPTAAALADGCASDPAAIKALDTEYQAAVAKNDAATMDRLLADDFILISSKGAVYGKDDLLAEARGGHLTYTRQDDSQQTVRFYGSTAVITALLVVRYTQDGKAADYQLWFSDVYACTPKGWRYSFGQAGAAQPLPDA